MNKIIICLDNNNWATTLTLNKEYIVTKEDDTYYYFTDDKNVDNAGHYKSRFKVKDWQPKCGDIVEVSETKDNWWERIFIAKSPNNKYYAVQCDHNKKFDTANSFEVVPWAYMRKSIEKIEISITCTINGKTKDPKEFTNDEWLALRNK